MSSTRTYKVVGALLAGAVVYVGACHPRYRTVTLPSGRTFDVISLTRDTVVNRTTSRTVASRVLLNYYARAQSEARLSEADDLLQLAAPAAAATGDSVIVIQQTYPVLSRWTGIVHGYMITYTRNSGEWQR